MSGRALGDVLWLGGGSGAGKMSLARTPARRHDVALYAADARGYAHPCTGYFADLSTFVGNHATIVPAD